VKVPLRCKIPNIDKIFKANSDEKISLVENIEFSLLDENLSLNKNLLLRKLYIILK
tara:strand:- start:106 stop:273 length:168 start_codon:yes stop_codon:yes gene_type:complete